MRLLLDTHAFLWFVWNHPSLSNTAIGLMTDPANELLISMGSLFEIAIKVSVNKLTLAEPYETFMDREIARNQLMVLPITAKHGMALTSLPFHHRDPFDRLLIAQAMVEGIPLLSADAVFDKYPITRLW